MNYAGRGLCKDKHTRNRQIRFEILNCRLNLAKISERQFSFTNVCASIKRNRKSSRNNSSTKTNSILQIICTEMKEAFLKTINEHEISSRKK